MDNIRVKEDSLNNWRAGFEIEEGKKKGLDGKACWDGYKLAGTKKKGGKTVDNCVKEDQGAVSYNTSDWRDEFHPTEIESIDIIKNKPLVNERYKFIGPGKGRKARDEDMSKHKGEKLGPNYLIPQASINKKKEVVAASHEVDLVNLN